jgi:hypothetical protein
MGETIAVSWNAEGIRQRFGESTLFPLKLFTQASWTALLFLGLTGLVAMIREGGLMATLAAVAMMALLKRTHPSVVGDRT